MPKISPVTVDAILDLTRKPLQANDAPQFFDAVKESFESLRLMLLGDGRTSPHVLRALEKAVHGCPIPRQRNILQVCSAPIFDKPALPAGSSDAMPEFLWLFCMPLTVQFSQAQIDRGLKFSSDFVDVGSVLRCALNAKAFNDHAMLSGFPTLLSKDDLLLIGPRNLATFFIQAEYGGAFSYSPPARNLDPEIESGRVSTYYMVGAARLTVGERQLFKKGVAWPAAAVEALLKQDFDKRGIEVETLTSFPATSIAEGLLRCSEAGAGELRAVLALAVDHYSIKEVVLLQSLDGMAELTGIDENGDEFVLCLPFSFVEPWSTVKHMAESASHSAGLQFRSASLAIPTSSMTH